MSSDDDERTIDRFVAGVRVDEADLAAAVAARAIDRTIVVESLVRALQDPEAAVRLRTAERLARMQDVGDELLARLRFAAYDDVDLRVRAAAAAALRARGEGDEAKRERRVPRILIALGFQPVTLRGTRSVIRLNAADRSVAPDAWVRIVADDELVRIALTGLPVDFVGTLPTLRILGDDGADRDVATATVPVAADRSLTIDVVPEQSGFDDVAAALAEGFELVVLEA